MKHLETLLDVQDKADRLAADLRQSHVELSKADEWQKLTDVLQQAVEAAESVKSAATLAAREEVYDQP